MFQQLFHTKHALFLKIGLDIRILIVQPMLHVLCGQEQYPKTWIDLSLLSISLQFSKVLAEAHEYKAVLTPLSLSCSLYSFSLLNCFLRN